MRIASTPVIVLLPVVVKGADPAECQPGMPAARFPSCPHDTRLHEGFQRAPCLGAQATTQRLQEACLELRRSRGRAAESSGREQGCRAAGMQPALWGALHGTALPRLLTTAEPLRRRRPGCRSAPPAGPSHPSHPPGRPGSPGGRSCRGRMGVCLLCFVSLCFFRL